MTTEEYIKVYEANKKFMNRVDHVAQMVGVLPDPDDNEFGCSFSWLLGNVWIGPDGTVEAYYDPDDNKAYDCGYGCPTIKFPKEFLDDSMTDKQIIKKAKELGIFGVEAED